MPRQVDGVADAIAALTTNFPDGIKQPYAAQRNFKHCCIVSTQAVLHRRHGMPSLPTELTETVSATHVCDMQTSAATLKISAVMLDVSTHPSS